MKNHLYLIGYMGTGKTTVGRILSENMCLPLLEMDEILISRFNMSINDVFETLGEDVFREAETLLLQDIAALDGPSIVSCGGGVPLKEENRVILKESGKSILLTASPSTLMSRLSDCKDRPLISDMEMSKIEEMLIKRKAAYDEAADYTITTDGFFPSEIAGTIMDILANA